MVLARLRRGIFASVSTVYVGMKMLGVGLSDRTVVV